MQWRSTVRGLMPSISSILIRRYVAGRVDHQSASQLLQQLQRASHTSVTRSICLKPTIIAVLKPAIQKALYNEERGGEYRVFLYGQNHEVHRSGCQYRGISKTPNRAKSSGLAVHSWETPSSAYTAAICVSRRRFRPRRKADNHIMHLFREVSVE